MVQEYINRTGIQVLRLWKSPEHTGTERGKLKRMGNDRNQRVTGKMQTEINPGTEAHFNRLRRPSQLYRIFGDGGVLLYVGIATNAKRRIYQHKCTASWAGLIRRHTVEDHAVREDAIAAEEQAIKAEKPLYNIRFAGRKARPAISNPSRNPSRSVSQPSFLDDMRELAEMAHMIQVYDPAIEGDEARAHGRFDAAMAEYQRQKSATALP
jgi:predicted GIY-YIG superfamily endonuclease